MRALGWLLMLAGSLLLTGEYLCVEVAWQCFNYDQFVMTLATLMLGTGFIATITDTSDD